MLLGRIKSPSISNPCVFQNGPNKCVCKLKDNNILGNCKVYVYVLDSSYVLVGVIGAIYALVGITVMLGVCPVGVVTFSKASFEKKTWCLVTQSCLLFFPNYDGAF